MNDITFFDLFSGIGGGRLGLERTDGFQCIFSCDINEEANKIYLRHWPNSNHYSGDIQQLTANKIPTHDVLIAGFPCQSFSVAGERRGLEDTRGTLFFEVARILQQKQPQVFILENVKGLLHNKKGQSFQIMLLALDELGYDCEWKLLDSRNFGIPQRRERLYVVGHLRGCSWRGPIFIRESNGNNPKAPAEEVKKVMVLQTAHLHPDRWGNWIKAQSYSDTLDTTGSLGIVDESGRGRLFTSIEKERLQGFPDEWTSGFSNSVRARLLGNAMTVNVVEAVGRRLKEVMS